MVVFATSKTKKPNESGEILFKGTLIECRNYCNTLPKDTYEGIHICEDNGIIKERIRGDLL